MNAHNPPGHRVWIGTAWHQDSLTELGAYGSLASAMRACHEDRVTQYPPETENYSLEWVRCEETLHSWSPDEKVRYDVKMAEVKP